MKWLKTMVVMAVLALWLPAANHCRLELIPGMDFLSCCLHEEAPADAHHEENCETDGCAEVEGGLYKTEKNLLTVVAPTLLADAIAPAGGVGAEARGSGGVRPDAAPPWVSWQFSLRAAGSPRAPSFAS